MSDNSLFIKIICPHFGYENYCLPQDMIPTPVLSEKEYHDIYRESFHWSNIEQLHALDRNTCFFFGLSMTDPNLRRLLDFSHTGSDNDPHHFAFLNYHVSSPNL